MKTPRFQLLLSELLILATTAAFGGVGGGGGHGGAGVGGGGRSSGGGGVHSSANAASHNSAGSHSPASAYHTPSARMGSGSISAPAVQPNFAGFARVSVAPQNPAATVGSSSPLRLAPDPPTLGIVSAATTPSPQNHPRAALIIRPDVGAAAQPSAAGTVPRTHGGVSGTTSSFQAGAGASGLSIHRTPGAGAVAQSPGGMVGSSSPLRLAPDPPTLGTKVQAGVSAVTVPSPSPQNRPLAALIIRPGTVATVRAPVAGTAASTQRSVSGTPKPLQAAGGQGSRLGIHTAPGAVATVGPRSGVRGWDHTGHRDFILGHGHHHHYPYCYPFFGFGYYYWGAPYYVYESPGVSEEYSYGPGSYGQDDSGYFQMGHDWAQDLQQNTASWDKFVEIMRTVVLSAPASAQDAFRNGFVELYGASGDAMYEKARQEALSQLPAQPELPAQPPDSSTTQPQLPPSIKETE